LSSPRRGAVRATRVIHQRTDGNTRHCAQRSTNSTSRTNNRTVFISGCPEKQLDSISWLSSSSEFTLVPIDESYTTAPGRDFLPSEPNEGLDHDPLGQVLGLEANATDAVQAPTSARCRLSTTPFPCVEGNRPLRHLCPDPSKIDPGNLPKFTFRRLFVLVGGSSAPDHILKLARSCQILPALCTTNTSYWAESASISAAHADL
jgi:hypothetical protein